MVALSSLVLCQLTPALLGGNAIAGERADRSAEFTLALQKPMRLQIMEGKIMGEFYIILPYIILLSSLFWSSPNVTCALTPPRNRLRHHVSGRDRGVFLARQLVLLEASGTLATVTK
jgi:hypothetical protein